MARYSISYTLALFEGQATVRGTINGRGFEGRYGRAGLNLRVGWRFSGEVKLTRPERTAIARALGAP